MSGHFNPVEPQRDESMDSEDAGSADGPSLDDPTPRNLIGPLPNVQAPSH